MSHSLSHLCPMWDNHVPVGDMTHIEQERLIDRCEVGHLTQCTLLDTHLPYPPIYLYSRDDLRDYRNRLLHSGASYVVRG